MRRETKVERKNLEDVLAITPLQEGMLFHYLKDAETDQYFEQLSLQLVGQIDTDSLLNAWRQVIATNEMLRTVFRWEQLEKPVQLVLKEYEPLIQVYDLTREDPADLPDILEKIRVKDRREKIDITSTPWRLILCQIDDTRSELIISYHHILFDGWSTGIVLGEFLDAYDALNRGEKPTIRVKSKFKDYLKWYQSQNRLAILNYWNGYLDTFDSKTPLPTVQRKQRDVVLAEKYTYSLGFSLSMRIRQFCREQKITQAVLFYTVWGLILHKYSDCNDVMFGTTVSGRVSEISGIEEMVGLFINTLPLRIKLALEKSVGELLIEVEKGIREREAYESISLREIKSCTNLDSKEALFDSIVVMENYPLDKVLNRQNETIFVKSFSIFEMTNFDLTVGITGVDDIEICFVYNTELFDSKNINFLAKNFTNFIESVLTNPVLRVSEMAILEKVEIEKILKMTEGIKLESSDNLTFQKLFERSVELSPDKVAVVDDLQVLTYSELNVKANKLARELSRKGVTSGQIVGLNLDRSVEMIIGMLGILKTGAAYLPIDPDYPEERINYMLMDSGVKLLLIREKDSEKIKTEVEFIFVEQLASLEHAESNLDLEYSVDNLAYVIYTSGSTGRPKGVLVGHRGIQNLHNFFLYDLGITATDRLTQFASVSFDASVWEIVMSLLGGCTLYIVPRRVIDNAAAFEAYVNEHGITVMTLPPTYLVNLNPECIQSLRILITAGSAPSVELVNRWKERVQYINAYGPTEGTICSNLWHFNADELGEEIVPIGKPISNTQVMVLNQSLQLQPVGVQGELCIAGVGLAQGYLNQPELTAEKFLPHPWIEGERIYRTGDLARLLPNGNIEFLGRKDSQVKIRGFRIELGEVEANLLRLPGIREAVLTVWKDANGVPALAAYYSAENELTNRELRESLLSYLPEYMVPTYFVQLAKLPMTPNGKIDLKALPAPLESSQCEVTYAAPRNFVEERLAQVWQDVLGVERVGIRDDFFALGGDSIKAIQIVSRLQKYELRLQVKELFSAPTIADVSKYVTSILSNSEQGLVVQEAKLTPIQKWFFSKNFTDKQQWNQAVMLYWPNGLSEEETKKLFAKIIEHHDALRLVYQLRNGEITQYNRGLEGHLFTLEHFDLRNEKNVVEKAKAYANHLQAGLNLEEGPLVKLGLFKTETGDHLLIVIHHLIIDGVSWRILLEDLALGYGQLQRGEAIEFQMKTDSFALWAEALQTYANSPELLQELDYWKKVAMTPSHTLPKVEDRGVGRIKDGRTLTIELTSLETEQLLKEASKAYKTEVNDLLLAALTKTLYEWLGESSVLINVEGHGREEIMEVDVKRTVGWFTSAYPLVLETGQAGDIRTLICATKERLRQIPSKGIGYGILRYLTVSEVNASPGLEVEPEINFNYLGQFDRDVRTEYFTHSEMSIGEPLSPECERVYPLDINGMIVNGMLRMTLQYTDGVFAEETIAQFSESLRKNLLVVVEHCIQVTEPVSTPSDFGGYPLNFEELALIQQKVGGRVEKIYPLTPMQEGMLYHALLDENSTAYFEQTMLQVKGHFQVDIFQESFKRLIQRYDIFRTVFVYEKLNRPRQVVLAERDPEMIFLDLSTELKVEQQQKVTELKTADRKRGFHLTNEPLIRVAIIQLGEEDYRVLLSHHHILIDGWCLGIVMKELFQGYRYVEEGFDVSTEDVVPYERYIHWLESQKRTDAIHYWENYLVDYEHQATLPRLQNGVESGYLLQEVAFALSEKETARLVKLAQDNHVTVNTIIQAFWGVLLQYYSNQEDVVFGSVVSGRPAAVAGIEQMVGLFINTIPIRARCKPERRFLELVEEMQNDALASELFQYLPLAEIQNLSEVKQNLIDHLLVFENYPLADQVANMRGSLSLGFSIEDIEVIEETHYDFNVIINLGKELKIRFSYNGYQYTKQYVEQIARHFFRLVEQVSMNGQVTLEDLTILGDAERQELLFAFNQTKSDYPREMTLPALFAAEVAKYPDKVAVIYEEEKLTYHQLQQNANQVAYILRQKGVGPETVVAVMVERSLEMIVGIMGILSAGGAYLPLPPDYPEERIQYMLTDSMARFLLTRRDLVLNLNFSGEKLYIDELLHEDLEVEQVSVCGSAKDLAYVMYTSGSTGRPKGNLTTHYNISRVVKGTNYIEILPEDKILQLSNYAFDGSTFDIFGALLNGATLVMVDKETLLNMNALTRLIMGQEITIFFTTTALFNTLVDINLECFATVRKVLFGGERVSVVHVECALKHLGPGRIIHVYGPTESTVFATYYPIDEVVEGANTIPIGRPLANTRIYVLGRNNQLQPIGVPGELCIAGEGLARGYLNQEELTREKFVQNPWISGEVIYKTGDLVRWLPDGNIEFIDRIDHQVKIRGFRIELGEIESSLLEHTAIQQATVLAKEDVFSRFLCAYFVADEELEIHELKAFLAKRLPEYMIPTYIFQLEQMPLTSNGKIDRKVLLEFLDELSSTEKYVAAVNVTEERLVDIWQEVLEKQRIGTRDNFFDLGGHSLKATVLSSRIHREFNVEIPLREIFSRPTIKEIAQLVEKAAEKDYVTINPAKVKDAYPVSSAQKRMFFLQQMEGGTSYNVPIVLLFKGKVNRDALKGAFRKLVERHEALRTSFTLMKGELVQRIHQIVDFHVEETTQYTEDFAGLIKQFIRPFDLEKAPLFRVRLHHISTEESLLLLDMHHSVTDGVSMGILVRELGALYHGQDLPELRVQYKDFVEWQLDEERLVEQEKYWLDRFAQELPVLNLPTDFSRPVMQNFLGERLTFELSAELTHQLKDLAYRTDTTLFMVLLAGFNLLLARYSSQEDIVVGTPIAGRNHAELAGVVGMFVNTLALRNTPKMNSTFRDFLGEVRENSLTAYEHQDYPFDRLVEKLVLNRDFSRNPLFDVFFVLQNLDLPELDLNGVECQFYEFDNHLSKFDLTLSAIESGDRLKLAFEYATALFRRETIERMACHLEQIFTKVVEDIERPMSSVEMLQSVEIDLLLNQFNATKTPYPDNITLHEVFYQQVIAHPDRIAAMYEDETLTYKELYDKSQSLGRFLRSKGVQPNKIVAIMVERSLDMTIGIFGILQAGGAYLPIAPEYPNERIGFILEDSGAEILLTHQRWVEKVEFSGEIVLLDNKDSYLNGIQLENITKSRDIAYVIYTSGSTGKPKGAMIEHHSAMNYLTWLQKRYPLSADDVILQKTPFTFDVSVWELFWWAIVGAKVAFLQPEGEKDPEMIVRATERYKATIMHFVPSALNVFLDFIANPGECERLSSITRVVASGEALTVQQVERFNTLINERYGTVLINLYGPTEATVDVSYFDCSTGEKFSVIPIGKPVDNIALLIVDGYNRLQPIGVPGELCIAGVGLARGYLNRPELTAAKFVVNPFVRGERMYRTGDLARWMPDGNIEYIGRIDHQVKLRGLRIELGEIDAKLLDHPEIREVVTIVRTDSANNQYLCSYIVANRELVIQELREYLGKYLPEYMVPSYFVQLEKMPLTTNEKVDRKALPEPDVNKMAGIKFVEPTSKLEAKLVAIWKEILDVETVGINNSFFELGGHSLKATNLANRIHQEFQVKIPLRQLFKMVTVQEQALYIAGAEVDLYASIEPIEVREYYPVSSAQKRMYILNQLEGAGTTYNMPQVFILEGKLERDRLDRVFYQLIARHEALRTAFVWKEEPVQLIDQIVDFHIQYMEIEESEVLKEVVALIKPFDLTKSPLLRVVVLEVSEDKAYLFIDMHHIISDGVSMGILIKDFVALYEQKELAPLRIQYKDYSDWQHRVFKQGLLLKQKEYWLKTFTGDIPELNLPTDYPRPLERSFAGESYSFSLDSVLTEKVQRLAQETNTTLYMVLLALYNVLLYKYTGQDDIIVGSPVAGRSHAELQEMIGMFVNTVAIRNHPQSGKTFKEFLSEVKETALKGFENQDYPFEELVDGLELPRNLSQNPLFSTMFVLQNMEIADFQLTDISLKSYELVSKIAKFDLTLNSVELDETLLFSLEYSTQLFTEKTIKAIAEHLSNIVRVVVDNPHIAIKDICMLSTAEVHRLVQEFNTPSTKATLCLKPIHELFEEVVALYPEVDALVLNNQRWSYQELNEHANRLANLLRKKGVGREKVVAIMLERSLEMVVGIIAIWKAEGAYLPIDPTYPTERIQYMLQDSRTEFLITSAEYKAQVQFVGTVVSVDDPEIAEQSKDNLEHTGHLEDLAYVIYTSGTTGQPKGVMVEQKSISQTLQWRREEYQFAQGDVALQLFSYSFDGFLTSCFTPLLAGAKVVLLNDSEAKDPIVMKERIYHEQITHCIAVPSLFRAILDALTAEEGKSLKVVTFAGEEVSANLVRDVKTEIPYLEIVNEYGPTEGTVVATIARNLQVDQLITIGRPVAQTGIYLLDQDQQLVAVGVPGEICIGGSRLARGYLHRLELTQEKFVSNPYVAGELMYKTGDLARWRVDGTLEFLGRLDNQVKVRGYRIELTEIERHLLSCEGVKEAVVINQKDLTNRSQLCAYVVGSSNVESTDYLRERLQQSLPEYMIPQHIIALEKMPLTVNGKLDRKALPEPTLVHSDTIYMGPRNEKEAVLVEIWQEVLQVDVVGLHDNFFNLGGDSIKAIQVAARLQRYGLRLETKELFQYPTIGELANRVKAVVTKSEQGLIMGDVQFSPIQQWFFAQNFIDKHHWNQAVMLYSKSGLSAEILAKVFTQLLTHHDSLRMVFPVVEGRVRQFNRGLEGEMFTLEEFDLRSDSEYPQTIEKLAGQIQQSINLMAGPLVKLGLFKTSDGDHLLIVIHHLVIDGVSWRILFEDLTTGYHQVVNNREIQFPEKTDSYQIWTRAIDSYAESRQLLKEVNYWKAVEAVPVASLPKDRVITSSLVENTVNAGFKLSRYETEKLLRRANHAYRTDVVDLLIAVLGVTVKEWAGVDYLLVNLEGHGREEIFEGVDVSRTVGWFTSAYPVVFDLSQSVEFAYLVKSVKETLRRIPNKGIGYGILRYQGGREVHETLQFNSKPEISFNYLGQFDADLKTSLFTLSSLQTGPQMSEKGERLNSLEVSAVVAHSEMNISFNYDRTEYDELTISKLLTKYQETLVRLIDHCVRKDVSEMTPTDLGDSTLTLKELDDIYQLMGTNIEKIYPLSPMQEGMLFHSLLSKESGAYFEQTVVQLEGKLEISRFEESFNRLIERYDILKTNFVYEKVQRPRQVVRSERVVKIRYEDITSMGIAEQNQYAKALQSQDQEQGFDLVKDLLIRLTVLKVEEERYKIIWSFHHILMDGWCLGIVMNEFFQIYKGLIRNQTVNLPQVVPYCNYIQWLEKQDEEEALGYWKEYFAHYRGRSILQKFTRNYPKGEYQNAEAIFFFDEALTRQLEVMAKSYQVTLSTVFQSLWAVLLQTYVNTADVVFGVVVSGRPAQIAGVEKMVGLFINTIPIRVETGSKLTFAELIQQIQQRALASERFDFMPLARIQGVTEQRQELMDHLVAFENYPLEKMVHSSELKVSQVETVEQTNYDFNLIVAPGKSLAVKISYNSLAFPLKTIQKIEQHLLAVAKYFVTNPQQVINEAEWKAALRQEILDSLDDLQEQLDLENRLLTEAEVDTGDFDF